MFKKQIKKIISTIKFRIFPVVSIAAILISQVFFIASVNVNSAQAEDLACTYDIRTKALRPAKVGITFTESGAELNTGVAGKYEILFSGVSSQFNGADCSGKFNIRLNIREPGTDSKEDGKNPTPAYPGRIISVPVNRDTQISKAENISGSLKVTGTFNIPDLKSAITDQSVLLGKSWRESILKDYSATSKYKSVIWLNTLENGVTHDIQAYSGGIGSSDSGSPKFLELFGCKDKTEICETHTGGNGNIDVTGGEASKLLLNEIKFRLGTKLEGTSAQFSPKDRASKEYQNFARIYYEGGKLVGFSINSIVYLAQPSDKTLVVNSTDPKKSSDIYLNAKSNETIVSKKAKFVGTGITDPKQVFKTINNYGCTAGETSTHYVYGNKSHQFNLCNPAIKEATNSVAMKAASEGFDFTLNMSDSSILVNKLNITKKVTCTGIDPETKKTTLNCNDASNDTLNIVDVHAILGLEEFSQSDTGWANALLAATGLGAVYEIYNQMHLLAQQWQYKDGMPVSGYPSNKFYIQIYDTKEAWLKNIDNPVPPAVPDAGEVITSTATNEPSTGQSLYAFIVRVISVVITWLQTIIYAAFAYILVPVLNALLKVRPYKDTFVNIIYPGWLILRNLANIFFIVSLLVVGLKILFQQSAASTAKNFILRLVLMALLVNFSLVISQGIVGIADTVQSQFLPADSKIIEALGSKLMVEPLKNFRDQVAGANDTFSTDDAEGSIADTVKPLVLLMLSLASFFSFAALAAFLLVRLVVLWVLYMTSPVAYVGYVMEETQTYAKQWWKEFLKYVIMTPVLVFFLNIAALMATLFSGQDNSIFEFSEGIAGDIVAATMTIISHFIVLFFIYVGMKFALSSGTIGAKTIVDYAKKGFDTFTSKPAKWAAGQAKEAAQTQWDRRFKGGMLDPKAHIGAFKEQVDKTTKAKMEKRLGSKANKLTPEGLYSNPKRALKYVLGGASAGTEGFQNEINTKRDEAAILTEAERDALTTALPTNLAKLNLKQNDMQAMDDGKLSLHMAETEIFNKLDDKIRSLEESKLEEVAELTRRGRISDADELGRDYDRQIASLTNVKTKIGDAMLASTDGKIVLDAETKDKVSVVFDADDVKAKLKDDVTDLENDINALTKDAERRNKFGYGVAGTTGAREIDFNRQMQLKNEAEKLEEQMNDHAMPVSLGARNARLTRESEAAKKIAHLEGEELRYAFKKAMADNNMDLAAAIAKKSAQEGDADMLLKEHGFKNNIEDFHKFINQKFASFGPSVRAQIGSEISALADKNGNAAIGKAYRVNNSGQLVGRTMQEQAKKVNTSIAKSPPEDVFKKKPTEISRQIGSNKYELYEGIVTNLNTMNKEKLKNMVRRMPAKTAQFIQKSANFNQLSLDVKLALEKTANKS